MALLSLNHDVLYEILSQTDSQSALKLSMVSRKAHELGIPQALSDVTLSRSQKQVSAFCQFVLTDPQNRLPYLRNLTIECGAFGIVRHIEFQRSADFSASSDLAKLLEKAYRLKSLSIACFEDLLVKEPRIGLAVCALPNLVDLGLHNCGQLTTALFPCMRSTPRKLAFTTLFNRKLPTFFHRLSSLDNLETLELSYVNLSDGSQPHDEVHEIPYMPSIRSLSLRGCTARMSLFVRAMPNVRVLHIADVFTKVEGESDQLKEACWPRLDHLKGNVPDFQRWRVSCPVRWLQLELTAYHYQDVLGMIEQNSPFILSLPVEMKVDAAFWTRLMAVASNLKYLELCLDEGKAQKLDSWMANVPQVIGTSAIIAINLCIRRSHTVGVDVNRVDGSHETGLRRLPERLAKMVPSLRFIGVSLANKGENPFDSPPLIPSWWRVSGASGTRQLEALPADVCRGVRERLLHTDYERHSKPSI